MKQYVGEDILRTMRGMPEELVARLRAAPAEPPITEYEARWWGFLQYARTGAYEGDAFVIVVNGTDDQHVESFLPYTLDVRSADRSAKLIRKTWPETGYDSCG